MMYPKYGNLNRQVDFPKHWIFGVPRFGQTRDQPIVNGGLQLGTPCLYMGYHQKGLCKGYVLEWNIAQNLQKRR